MIDVYPPPYLSSAASVLGFRENFGNGTAVGTALVDIPGSEVTVFVPSPGRWLRVSSKSHLSTGAVATRVGFHIREGSTNHNSRWWPIPANLGGLDLGVEAIIFATPGPHTYKLSANATAAGSFAIYTTATIYNYLLVEDITGGNGGPGPILLDYKQLTSTQAGITGTLVDVTNLSCTVNVPAGRALRITSKMQVLSTGATGDIYMPILEDGVVKGRVTYRTLTVDQYMNPLGSIVVYPTPGTHTYKVQAAKWTGGGGMEIRPAADNPAYILVEDITGTEAPTGAYYEAVWTPATLTNGWVNYDVNTYPAAAYRKVNDLVYLRGLVRNGTIGASGFNLPPGYRPPRNHHFLVNGNDLPCSVRVLMGGDVWIGTGSQSNVWIDIAGIVFGVT